MVQKIGHKGKYLSQLDRIQSNYGHVIFDLVPLKNLEDIEKLMPGFIEVYNSVADRLKGLELLNPRYIGRMPAILLYRSEVLKELIKNATVNSTAPKNLERDYAHFEVFSYTFHFDIDEINILMVSNPEEVPSIFAEEMIHAITTSYKGKRSNTGFVSLENEKIEEPVPQGIYTCTISQKQPEEKELVEGFVENEIEIVSTENLTDLAKLLKISRKEMITLSLVNKDRIVLIIGSFLIQAIEETFKKQTGRALSELIIQCLSSGDIKSIQRLIIPPLKRIVIKKPQYFRLIEVFETLIFSPNLRIIEMDNWLSSSIEL